MSCHVIRSPWNPGRLSTASVVDHGRRVSVDQRTRGPLERSQPSSGPGTQLASPRRASPGASVRAEHLDDDVVDCCDVDPVRLEVVFDDEAWILSVLHEHA